MEHERSRTPGHSVCLKKMSRTIAMQGLTLTATTTTEKRTVMLDATYKHDKVNVCEI